CATPFCYSLTRPVPHRALHSFPTRRSSDLPDQSDVSRHEPVRLLAWGHGIPPVPDHGGRSEVGFARRERVVPDLGRAAEIGHHTDRKSTRLNSSHVKTSYAVFCLKKKNDAM